VLHLISSRYHTEKPSSSGRTQKLHPNSREVTSRTIRLSKSDSPAEKILSHLLSQSDLKESSATRTVDPAPQNVLHQCDSITQEVVTELLKQQKNQPSTQGCVRMRVGNATVVFVRKVGIAELKRFRRDFVKWVGLHPPEGGGKDTIVEEFLKYVVLQIQ